MSSHPLQSPTSPTPGPGPRVERRQDRRRRQTVTTALEILQIVTALVATTALILTLLHLGDRRAAARDGCRELRAAVRVAAPPARQAQAQAFIIRAGLADCDAYARRLVP